MRPTLWVAAILFLLLASCSSQRPLFTPVPGFDPAGYVSPQQYGYPLELDPVGTAPVTPERDRSFTPVAFEGGLSGLQDQVQYPRAYMRTRTTGTVLLEVYVDTTNAIANIVEIRSPASYLTEAAIETVTEADHTPAVKDGEAVNSFIRIPLTYRLYGVEVRRDYRDE